MICKNQKCTSTSPADLVANLKETLKKDTLASTIVEFSVSYNRRYSLFSVVLSISKKNNALLKYFYDTPLEPLSLTDCLAVFAYKKNKEIALDACEMLAWIQLNDHYSKDFTYRFFQQEAHLYCRAYLEPIESLQFRHYLASSNSLPHTTPLPPSNLPNTITTKRLKSASYKTALTQRAAAFLSHELFGHSLERCVQLREIQSLALQLPKTMSLIDNPLQPDLYGSYYMDQNGKNAKKIILIQDGKPIHSLECSKRQRAENFEYDQTPRMSNLLLDSSEKLETTDILSTLGDGILIEDFYEGMEATVTNGTVKVKTLFGREVVDGKLTDTVYPNITLSTSLAQFNNGLVAFYGDVDSRPIDCFESASGWIRTTSSSPNIILNALLHSLDTHSELS